MSKLIALTQGKFAIVDNEDFDELSKHKWNACSDRGNFYARRLQRKGIKRINIHMHREVINAPVGIEVDHKNGNGLDNQKCNLRLCTRFENTRNRHQKIKNQSGYKGVTPEGKKWKSRIRVNGKEKYLGLFGSKKLAARIYDDAAREYFGEFASTNFR